jgi:hypothetical protein
VETQEEVCSRFGVVAEPLDLGGKLGIALATIGEFPINGLRVRVDGTCRWFVWGGGEASTDRDFYQPLHVAHIAEYLPMVEPYLSLPPGYRFQIADGHEDVWFDPALLVEK